MKDRAVKIYSWFYYYGSLFRAIQYAQYLCAYFKSRFSSFVLICIGKNKFSRYSFKTHPLVSLAPSHPHSILRNFAPMPPVISLPHILFPLLPDRGELEDTVLVHITSLLQDIQPLRSLFLKKPPAYASVLHSKPL